MSILTRRSILRSSAALAAAGTLARPYIANAQAKTAELWWPQGFVQEEDISIKKAGFKMADIPKTWDAYYDFFKEVQKKLRDQRVRNVYGLGLNVTTNGNDPNNVFNYFLTAYGGEGIVTKDGKFHPEDPQVKEAVIKALTYPTKIGRASCR